MPFSGQCRGGRRAPNTTSIPSRLSRFLLFLMSSASHLSSPFGQSARMDWVPGSAGLVLTPAPAACRGPMGSVLHAVPSCCLALSCPPRSGSVTISLSLSPSFTVANTGCLLCAGDTGLDETHPWWSAELTGGRRMCRQTSTVWCGKCWGDSMTDGTRDRRRGTDQLCRGETREGFTEEVTFELGL